MCMSVPQIELASTSTRTSRRPGLGLGHISYSAPGPGLALTILCICSLDELTGKLLFTAFHYPVKYYWQRSRFQPGAICLRLFCNCLGYFIERCRATISDGVNLIRRILPWSD